MSKNPKTKSDKTEKKKKTQKRRTRKPKGLFSKIDSGNLFTIILILLFLFSFLFGDTNAILNKVEEINLTEVASEIKAGAVKEIDVKGDKLAIVLKDGTKYTSKKEREASLTETLANYGISGDDLASVEINVKNESGVGFWILQLLPTIFFILLIYITYVIYRKQSRGGVKLFSFGQSKARIVQPDKKSTKFEDVAGNIEAKRELMEVVEFLKKPEKFLRLGAKIPKGVLLVGAPGTGKTLMARAVAGEAGVPFLHISGSEFVEMFVGVGASRVRDLFNTAKKLAPSIIFIDEIDAVGRSRGVGIGGGNDEREQTLNQILVEMDGFEINNRVVVIAATNREDVLDPALLRPGRFDRKVTLELPDRKDREAILKIHIKGKPVEENIDLALVAKRTHGFSGADLEALINEAAILAARENESKIKLIHILNSIDKVMLGPERRSHLLTDEERRVVAYHEAGHAIVSSCAKYPIPVHKISIVSRGHAGGYVLNYHEKERKLLSKKEYISRLAILMGGYVAEKEYFGSTTSGPSSDIKSATAIARNMVLHWGMSDLGPINFGDDVSARAVGISGAEYSEDMKKKIDSEIEKIINEALKEASEVIRDKRSVVDKIAKKLLADEVLEKEEFEKLLLENGIEVAKDTCDASANKKTESAPDDNGENERGEEADASPDDKI